MEQFVSAASFFDSPMPKVCPIPPDDPQARLQGRFHEAVAANDVEAIKRLVAEGLDTKAFGAETGCTALMIAVVWGRVDCMRFLTPFSDVDAQEPGTRLSALMHAVLGSNAKEGLDCVEFLATKANPNAQEKAGFTALMFAAKNRNPKMVEALLRVSDLRTETKQGDTAFEVALQGGDSECVDRVAQAETPENISKRREIVETLFKAAGPEKMPRWAARLEAEAIRAALSGAENDEAALQTSAPQRRTKSL